MCTHIACMYVCTSPHMCLCLWWSEKGTGFLRIEPLGGCEPPYMYWTLNLGPLTHRFSSSLCVYSVLHVYMFPIPQILCKRYLTANTILKLSLVLFLVYNESIISVLIEVDCFFNFDCCMSSVLLIYHFYWHLTFHHMPQLSSSCHMKGISLILCSHMSFHSLWVGGNSCF